MIKKIILDKADRLYHFPFDLEDYIPQRAIKTSERKTPTIDLAHFHWLAENVNLTPENLSMEMAHADDMASLNQAFADWLAHEYGLNVNPRKEIYAGLGVRRIIFDICMAFVEYGDVVMCPEPGMPFYRKGTIAAGGIPVTYKVSDKTDFKPALSKIPTNLGKSAKILVLNSPSNPFGVILDETELAQMASLASQQNIFLVNDAAYCSLSELKFVPLRSMPGGSKVSLEIFSVPFAFGLPYIPLAFAVGPPDVIASMETIGRTIGAQLPKIWIEPIMKAINEYPGVSLKSMKKRFSQVRLEAEKLCEQNQWKIIGGKSAPFVWIRIPGRRHSNAYAAALLRRKRILTLPGTAFGDLGEGYIRLSLTASVSDYQEAAQRMSKRPFLKKSPGE